ARQPARAARARLAAIHRLRPRTRDRPVQGRNHRLVPRAELAAGREARRMAEAARERTRRIQGAETWQEGRALRRQPNFPILQRPADEGYGDLREAQGPDHHYLAAAAVGDC